MISATVDVRDWFIKWNAAEKQILRVSQDVINEAATLLYTKIINYTPVGDPSLWKYAPPPGYKPGTLKKSWTITFTPTVVTITNPQPYALRVEYGWSTQAPVGMMRKSIAEFPDFLEQAAKRYNF